MVVEATESQQASPISQDNRLAQSGDRRNLPPLAPPAQKQLYEVFASVGGQPGKNPGQPGAMGG
jgi:hypothetical protein